MLLHWAKPSSVMRLHSSIDRSCNLLRPTLMTFPIKCQLAALHLLCTALPYLVEYRRPVRVLYVNGKISSTAQVASIRRMGGICES